MLPPNCPECGQATTGDLGISLDLNIGGWVRRFRCNHCQATFQIPHLDPRIGFSIPSRNGHVCRWWLCYKLSSCRRTCSICQLPELTRCETCLSGCLSEK